jgi:hypothetical protein
LFFDILQWEKVRLVAGGWNAREFHATNPALFGTGQGEGVFSLPETVSQHAQTRLNTPKHGVRFFTAKAADLSRRLAMPKHSDGGSSWRRRIGLPGGSPGASVAMGEAKSARKSKVIQGNPR